MMQIVHDRRATREMPVRGESHEHSELHYLCDGTSFSCRCDSHVVCGFALVLVPAGKAATTEFKVIHTFQGKKDGEYPEAGLTLSDGQMFSTTFGSLGKPGKVCSKGGCGNNFAIQGKHLTPGYSFEGGQDGAFPRGKWLSTTTSSSASRNMAADRRAMDWLRHGVRGSRQHGSAAVSVLL